MEQNKPIEFEVRNSGVECRAVEREGRRYLEGYAAVFEQKSKLIHQWYDVFYEIIRKGAFDEVLKQDNLDVILTTNHDYSKVIARTISGTLKLETDEKGLKYTAEMPDNITYANDIYESVKRGDTFESSFTFMVDDSGQTYSVDESGVDLRYINSVKILREVAPVTWGAYSNTEVSARGFKEFKENCTKKTQQIPLDIFKRKIHNLKLKK